MTLVAIRRLFREGYGSWLVAPALIVGLALRLFNLGERNTWYDEISSILFAEKGLSAIIKATAADTMPRCTIFFSISGSFWAIVCGWPGPFRSFSASEWW
ncbi:MAG: hypothetical protein Q7O66_06115 [Dehalococcoidia bacterium]|nr:hypothetical protein [Dehalococcoidia bacterium]